MRAWRSFVAIATTAGMISAGCSTFGRYVADMLYDKLDLPLDREAAFTVVSSPPSPDIRAVIGGRGEGLDCSIPSVVEALFFERMAGVEAPVSLQFRQGCVFHDNCYRHGYATYGYTQADCDFILLQQAFRTCVQIYEIGLLLTSHEYAGAKTKEICDDRARELLLGVTIGGYGSFKVREQSSYYEFDPAPIRADNYSVARLVRVPKDRTSEVDGKLLLSSPTIFQFNKARITIRQLGWKSGGTLGDKDRPFSEVVFPGNAVPTPPNVVRAGDKDWVIWVSRHAASNTEFTALVGVSGGKYGDKIFGELPCPLRKPRALCDFDASVIQVVQSSDANLGVVSFFAFAHRFSNKTDGRNAYPARTIGLHHWDIAVTGLMTAFKGEETASPPALPAALPEVSSFRERFLQSELHVGEFRRSGCSEVVALGRGIHLRLDGSAHKGKADEAVSGRGDRYREAVTAAFIPLAAKRCPEAALIPVVLPQATEPAVPVRKGSEKTDRLLTVSAVGERVPLILSEYAFGDTTVSKRQAVVQTRARDSQGSEVPLDASWVKSAAYVVRSPTGIGGDRLFFSRVKLDPREMKRFEKGEGPDRVRIEFRYFAAAETGWAERGYSSCEVDLNKQHRIEPTDSLMRTLNWRLAYEGPHKPEERPLVEALFRRLDKREMVRQWMQSQVIPGYIFADETSASDRPIDAVVIFHGSADYSLLLKGIGGGEGEVDRLEIVRPAGHFEFASCAASS